jgi:hypothetical protein
MVTDTRSARAGIAGIDKAMSATIVIHRIAVIALFTGINYAIAASMIANAGSARTNKTRVDKAVATAVTIDGISVVAFLTRI